MMAAVRRRIPSNGTLAVRPCSSRTVAEVVEKPYSRASKPLIASWYSPARRFEKVNWPPASVISVSSAPMPCRLTVTSESPLPSTLTWPAIADSRTYVPSKLHTFDSPALTSMALDVAENATPVASKPVISTV